MSVSSLPFAAPGAAMPWRRCLVLVLTLHLLAAALLWPWRDKAAPPWVPPPAVMVLMAAAPQFGRGKTTAGTKDAAASG